jgi:hypothetical protein
MVDALRRQYPYVDLLQALIQARIPRQGTLPGDCHFAFHGVGCRFATPSTKLDVDFGPAGRCDGFDAWRLYLFANENKLPVGRPSLSQIEDGILELERAGEVEQPRTDPSPHLLYLCGLTGGAKEAKAGSGWESPPTPPTDPYVRD